jgi:5-methylcytosine-specific restriction endonuclease McrA
MPGKRAGRSGANWRRLRTEVRSIGAVCFNCGQPIDYTLHWPDAGSFTVDHRLPLTRHPELAEDPANLVPSHLRCNQIKGDREEPLSLGNRSEDW